VDSQMYIKPQSRVGYVSVKQTYTPPGSCLTNAYYTLAYYT